MTSPTGDLTYAPVGVTLDDERMLLSPLEGFRVTERVTRLGTGPELWTSAGDVLMQWAVKTRSGFSIDGDVPRRAAVGQRLRVLAHLGPFRLPEPVEVVAVVDEPERTGFAYGTLPGHPISGEEAFLLLRQPDDSVVLVVRSVSRHASGLRRLIHPFALLARPVYLRRYARSLG